MRTTRLRLIHAVWRLRRAQPDLSHSAVARRLEISRSAVVTASAWLARLGPSPTWEQIEAHPDAAEAVAVRDRRRRITEALTGRRLEPMELARELGIDHEIVCADLRRTPGVVRERGFYTYRRAR